MNNHTKFVPFRINRVAIFCLVGLSAAAPDVLSISQNECANPPTGAVFCEDFEGPNPKGNFDDYDGNADTENKIVTDNGPVDNPSNKVVRFRVPAGQSGVSDLIKVLPASYDKLYARWYFKYEPGFDFNALNHGGGLSAGDRSYVGVSSNRPSGADFAGFYVEYQRVTAKPFAYSYYRGMYQDCTDPVGSCWGDSLPCVYDNGESYCIKSQHRPSVTMPTIQAGRWYCVEEMLDMGTPTMNGYSADGQFALWLDDELLGNYTDLWLRTTASLKIQNVWMSLFHHDGAHSTVGELIDNIVISTERIGCGTQLPPNPLSSPTNLRVVP